MLVGVPATGRRTPWPSPRRSRTTRTPRVSADGLTVAGLCSAFPTARTRQRDGGELSARTFDGHKAATDRFVGAFGMTRLVSDLAADDSKVLRAGLAKRFGPVRLGNEVQRIWTAFKYAYDAGRIDKPVRYGPQVKKPSRKVMRVRRAAGGAKPFSADERDPSPFP